MRSRRLANLLGLGVVTLAVLTACTMTPPPPPMTSAPTPAPTPTPTPTSTPEPEAVAERIAISTETITVFDEHGTALAKFDYFQPTEEVVDGLSAYLGEPVDTPFEGRNDMPSAIYHDWGGLRLVDSTPPASPPYHPEHWLMVTGADANGLDVVGPGDARVGSPLDSSGASDISEYANPEIDRVYQSFRRDLVELPPFPWNDPAVDAVPSLGVRIGGYLDTGLVERIIAPSGNFGA
jgi:hypothetical protein